MVSITLLSSLLFLITGFYPVEDQISGRITGTVTDAITQEALIGVNILVSGTSLGAATDTEGNFEISGLEAGLYNVEFRYLGYQSFVQSDVLVRNHRPATLTIALFPSAIEGEEVIVRASFFSRNDAAPVSRIGFNAEEIRRSPGAGQELSRVIMATPGVATNGDTSQDLLVRGGSPSENGFYIDHIPLPTVNHFERQNGRTNGPIGIVNTDLVEELTFYAGGFSSMYGNHASSVANIRYREGSRDRFHGSLDMNMAGFGFILENPVAGGKGSVLFSARRSYLDILANAINAGGAPRYGDVQFKAVYDITKNSKITLLNVYGDSLFENDIEEAREQGFDVFTRARTYQNTTGINWRQFWSSNVLSNTSIAWSFKMDDTKILYVEDLRPDIDFDIYKTFTTFRNTNFYRASDVHRYEFGVQAEYRTGRFDYFIGEQINPAGIVHPEQQVNLDKDEWYFGAFTTWMSRPTPNISTSLGGRLEHNTINAHTSFSPRLALRYDLTPRTALTGALGRYRQSIPLFFRSQNSDFEHLNDFFSDQLILGVQYQLTEETLLSMEVYEKRYRNLPALPENHSLGIEIFVMETEVFYENLTDDGEAYARGLDVLLQKKLAQNLYGMVSASFFRSEYKDSKGNWVSRAFDVNYLFHIIAGYRPNNNWEFSARWSYIGQRPMTPIDIEASRMMEQTMLDYSRYNQARMPAYHSLFVRFDRRWFYNNRSMTTFMEVWNSYNRKNIEAFFWSNEYQEVRSFNQFSLLPVGGFAIEF